MKRTIRKPNFFIVGAPKSGTTAMTDYLSRHSQIFIPQVKELHFFGSDLTKSRKLEQDLKTYLSWFKPADNYKKIGESSAYYLYSKMAAIEIRDFNPSAQIIIMLRNPVDMMYSFHSQLIYGGFEDIADFQEALDAEEDRKQGHRIPKGAQIIETLYYREAGRYADQVKRYFEVFGQEKVHIIIFDDFKSDIAGIYRETMRFLEVNENHQPDFKVINPNKRVRSKTLRDMYQRPPQVILTCTRTLLPAGIRRWFMSGLRNLNTKYILRPPMDPNLRHRLQTEFAQEVERLSELLNRDLTHWSRN